ncbi:MAG: PilW family protein, partial [bacterium]
MKIKKGFSLVEIIIAIVIFLFVIIWVIDIFKNMNLEKRITLENAKLNENVMILEKNIKNFINEANLDLGDNLDFLQSNLQQIKPYFLPTCIISPNIYERESGRLIIYYNQRFNNNDIDLVSINAQNNQIIFMGFGGQNFIRFNVVQGNQGGVFFWYFTIPDVNFNTINVINFDRPIIYPASNYNINLTFRRQSIVNGNDI